MVCGGRKDRNSPRRDCADGIGDPDHARTGEGENPRCRSDRQQRTAHDAVESIACAYLAGVVMLGLLAQLLAGWWWVDSITSLAIVVFLVKEGWEAWYSEECKAAG